MNEAALWRRLVAELLGSAFLAAIVIGSGIAAQRLSPGNVGLRVARKRCCHRSGALRHHLDVRGRYGSALQPDRVVRRRSFRWASAGALLAPTFGSGRRMYWREPS